MRTWISWVVALAGAAPTALAGPPGGPLEVGRQVYERCAACHSIDRDRAGPRHCGLFGRLAGSVPGFEYTEAMRSSRIVWTRRTLDRFLADPMAVVPGTRMYLSVESPTEREALLAYLQVATDPLACGEERPGSVE